MKKTNLQSLRLARAVFIFNTKDKGGSPMHMTQRKTAILTLVLTLSFSITTFAADASQAAANASRFGIFTILPPLIAIALAFITKNVIISLFLGSLTGFFIINIADKNIFSALIGSFLSFIQAALYSLADSWNAGIILQVLVIGGVVALVSKMGGAKAVAEAIVKKAKSPVSTQIATFLLGLLVFFDDYANALIVGPIMRPIYDKMKISREKLAFVVDATAAPIAGIAIISTWIGLEISLIRSAYASSGQEVDAFGIFLKTIPYRFYNIFMLVFVVLTAVMMREFGPMLKAEIRARKGEKSKTPAIGQGDFQDMEPKEGIKPSILNAVIPIGTLIVASLLSFYFSGREALFAEGDEALIALVTQNPFSLRALQECVGMADASVALFQSALFAAIVAIIMAISKKIFTLTESIEVFISGMKNLLVTGVILILAWSLSSVIKELGTAAFLVENLSDKVPYFILPSFIFVLGSIISFSTGTAYGTMGIMMPLAVPFAIAINPDLSYTVVCTSAVLTSAIFGDHCSPISDTTILSSMGSSCNHMDHVNTQMPYALFVAGVAITLGYLPAGFGISWFILLPVGILALIGLLRVFGKKVV